jgi:PAS domain S-box-containing protein
MDTEPSFSSAAQDESPVRVLIVEDDMIIALALRQMISLYGWQCAGICGDAQSAFDYFEKCSAEIVFMDISLKGMIDGIDAAEILLSRFGVHVIFLTSYSNPETVGRIRASEPYGYVLKPFTETDIYVSVSLALTIRGMTRKLRDKEEELDSALSSTRIGTWRYDPARGFNAVDANMCAIFGLSPVRRLMDWDELQTHIHPDDRELVAREAQRAVDEAGSFEFDVRFIHSDGSIRWARDRGIFRTDSESGNGYLTGAIFDITERKQLEDKILGIRESQRQEIGQILHDDIGQQMTGITLLAESLVGLLESKGLLEEAGKARVVADRSYAALEDLRLVARNLYPVQITPDGFADALSSLAYDAQSLSGMECTFSNLAGETSLSNSQATQMYYIAREAVNNSIKHSSGSHILIGMTRKENRICVAVSDNGSGFVHCSHSKGIGLDIMQFRAGMSNGEFSIKENEDGGTTVMIIVREGEGDGKENRD